MSKDNKTECAVWSSLDCVLMLLVADVPIPHITRGELNSWKQGLFFRLKPSGHYRYRQFNIKHSTFCPHSVFMCFVWISEQTAIISQYSINWLTFITETECVHCAVRTGSLNIILRSAHTVYLCVFVWIWEQTTIISLYSIKWLVIITEMECVYWAVRAESLNIIQVNLHLWRVSGRK